MTHSIGIAIPSYEQGRWVSETIESIRRLTTPFEAVIQDAGSSAPTLDTIRTAIAGDSRFALVVEPDDGQSDAINRAWNRLAQDHPLLTWVNTDDLLVSPGFDRMLSELHSSEQDVLVGFGDFTIIDGEGRALGRVRRPNHPTTSMLLHLHNAVPGVGMAIRTDAVRRAGPLATDLRWAMDYEYWLRLAQLGELRRFPYHTAAFRWHDAAKTAGDPDASEREEAVVRRRHVDVESASFRMRRLGWRVAAKAMRSIGPWNEPDMTNVGVEQ